MAPSRPGPTGLQRPIANHPPWGALLVLSLGNPGSAEVHKQYALNERYEIADEWIC